jgi:hypothetical protein
MMRAPVPKNILRILCGGYAALATFAATCLFIKELFPTLSNLANGFLALCVTIGTFFALRDNTEAVPTEDQ